MRCVKRHRQCSSHVFPHVCILLRQYAVRNGSLKQLSVLAYSYQRRFDVG